MFILQKVKEFDKPLFTKAEAVEADKKEMLGRLQKIITPSKKQLCEEPVSLKQLGFALRDMSPGKSPGTDGLTVEFYKTFWQLVNFFYKFISDQTFLSSKYGGLL